MAQTATMYRVQVALSDVDRGVYEALDVRLAQHPSESMRFLITRLLAYALSYEEGIAFSKAGIADTAEPTISVRDATGLLLAWIDVGSPSVERLHKASKSAPRVAIFTHASLAQQERDAASIHRADKIEVHRVDASFLDALERHLDRHTKMELVRNEGQLYATIDGAVHETALVSSTLMSS